MVSRKPKITYQQSLALNSLEWQRQQLTRLGHIEAAKIITEVYEKVLDEMVEQNAKK